MAILSGRKGGRALSRIAVAAIAAALVGTTAGAASADSTPSSAAKTAQSAQKTAKAKQSGSSANSSFAAGETPTAETFPLIAADGSGQAYLYPPNGTGGFGERVALGDYSKFSQVTKVDNNKDGAFDAFYELYTNGHLVYDSVDGTPKDLGAGWDAYNLVFSAGDLGGAPADDLIARDKAGVLWLYTANADGSFAPRVKLGAGWGAMTKIAGRGDMNGDGKADIVAVDNSGVAWLYPGTGNWAAPFGNRVKLGAGWNTYNKLVGLGDLDFDGKVDLVGRDASGDLWFYPGTGTTAGSPFKDRVKVGTGWNGMRLMF
ncbi:FG-GAP repeat domain-containing protein [Streptomyces violascens]|uniref:VCBS repeat-containing protein n=1 Tax=Streptomyces violascens TaxID=67381 RepID=A0ABQ3QYD8_9ACTN|nr:VCBS repeat-containing protein [Streptomyces violascens]GGU22683.1 hypothetical protein GCM10010289_50380 [Streptomyces violascens]GHI42297.1 hypothetical protein Sviol_67050 [Streptomyces violascens]